MVGAFVNFGADVVAPGRILLGNRATFRIGELDGTTASGCARWRPTSRTPRRPPTCSATCGRSRPTGRCCSRPRSATCRSPTRWPTPPTGRCSWRWRARCWTPAPVTPEPFDGFDPADLEGSIERLAEFNRGSAKTHSGIYRDLAVRHRPTEVRRHAGPGGDGRWCAARCELIRAIEDGRRRCRRAEPRPARRLRAAGAAGPAAERGDLGDRRARPRRGRAAGRRAGRRQGQHRRRRRRSPPTPRRVGVPAAGRRATPSWCGGCARPAPSCSARPTCSSTPPAASTRPTA